VRLKRFARNRRDDLELVTISLASYAPAHLARTLTLRAWGANLDRTTTLYHGFQVRRARSLTIGPRSSIGDGAILDARGGLCIGSDVNLSTQVHIWTGQHGWNTSDFAYESAPVHVGNHVWLSARVTVLPGVTVGEGAVVAAGAVVTNDLPPHGLYGGVPARRLGDRDPSIDYRLSASREKPWWW
jgi:serine acetyltransferase